MQIPKCRGTDQQHPPQSSPLRLALSICDKEASPPIIAPAAGGVQARRAVTAIIAHAA